jgi:hypothetical protein
MDEYVVASFLIFGTIALVVALVFRPFILWYFKINERAKIAAEAAATLRHIRDRLPEPKE